MRLDVNGGPFGGNVRGSDRGNRLFSSFFGHNFERLTLFNVSDCGKRMTDESKESKEKIKKDLNE
jgi:hypothetical protein